VADLAKTILGETISILPSPDNSDSLVRQDALYPSDQKERERSRLLTSLRMRDLAQAYILWLREHYLASVAAIEISYLLPRDHASKGPALMYTHAGEIAMLHLSAKQVQCILQEIMKGVNKGSGKTVSLQSQREQLLMVCLTSLWQQFQQSRYFTIPPISDPERILQYRQTAFRRDLQEKLSLQIRSWYPEITPSDCIQSFLSNSSLMSALREFPHKSFTNEEITLLTSFSSGQSYLSWAEHDLPLLWLAHLHISSQPSPQYDCVAIDEAQDVSPLELFLVRQYAKQMIVVGDLAQGIFAHRGLSSWKEARKALGEPEHTSSYTLHHSYRSTWEITQLANHILEQGRFSTPMLLAEALERHGPSPTSLACSGFQTMAEKSLQLAQEAVASGKQSIAIIAKTEQICQDLYHSFLPEDTQFITLVTHPDQKISQRMVILPIWLAKGLEFDAVIVVGVDSQSFSKREQDAKLLYVAVTRALHELTLLYVGPKTALL
jgi:hypothetical protein